MAVYAIGDIQGCFTELDELLASIEFDRARDRLWFVGDLVNRGPESLQVLRFVRSLGAAAITVLGNHDLHLLAVAFGRKERLRADDTLDEVLRARDRDELLDWLRHQPLLHHDAQLNYTMVHAALSPQWDLRTAQSCAREVEKALRDESRTAELFSEMYGNLPDLWSTDLQGMDRIRYAVNCFTRLRVCDSEGKLALKYKGTLKDVPADHYPWFRFPERRSENLTIVCGHWSAIDFYDSRTTDERVLAIDTGCVWGNRLCAIRIDQPAEPVFVKSHQPKRSGD